MKYTTTVIALAVVTATSVEGQRRNFRTLNKGQMHRRELQDGSMSMITQYKSSMGSAQSKQSTTTGSSSDEPLSCADKLTGSWSATEEDICKLFTIDSDGTVKKDCSRNQAFTFDVDSETDTLQMTSNFIRLSTGELEKLTKIGFINDKDGTCSFKAVSVSSSNTVEGSVGEDGVLHVENTKPGGVENDSAGAFQGLFTKVPGVFPFTPAPVVCFDEGEECRTDDPDLINGGCSSPNQDKFGSIVPGETKCGTVSTYVVKEGRMKRNVRDTDSFKFTWEGGTISATLKGNFGFGLLFLGTLNGGVGCANATEIDMIASEDKDSTDITLFANLDPGEYVWVVTVDNDEDLNFRDFNECGGKKGNDYIFSFQRNLLGHPDGFSLSSAGKGGVSFPAAEGPITYDDE